MNSYIIGVDIGGTSERFVIYDIKKKEFSTIIKNDFVHTGDAVTEVDKNLCWAIDSIIEEMTESGMELLGIGISTAALFDRQTGQVTIWPNNRTWDNFPLKEYLFKRYHVNIFMEDDSNCAALGEYWELNDAKINSLIYITISTGISCGIILNHSLYIGQHGWAGEIGHICVQEQGVKCVCGKVGCLQAFASGPAIVASYCETSQSKQGEYTLSEIGALAQNGDQNAIYAFKIAANYIAQMIEVLSIILDISDFVLGGGVLNTGSILIDEIERNVFRRLEGSNRKIKLMYSKLKDKNGLVGAVKLCLSALNVD